MGRESQDAGGEEKRAPDPSKLRDRPVTKQASVPGPGVVGE